MKGEDATDVLIIGGGLGGVAAALSALRLGKKVILIEPTDWIGGQLTAQAVPPDEHPWIEGTGRTSTYDLLRKNIRNYYRCNYPLLPKARFDERLNPGYGKVSPICHEPRVALAAMSAMLAPYLASGNLDIVLQHRPVGVETDGDVVLAVQVCNNITNNSFFIEAPYVLDATELGDLLPMAGVEYVIGSESQAQTGEPHCLARRSRPARSTGGYLVFCP